MAKQGGANSNSGIGIGFNHFLKMPLRRAA
jgi:hypothetical protein